MLLLLLLLPTATSTLFALADVGRRKNYDDTIYHKYSPKT